MGERPGTYSGVPSRCPVCGKRLVRWEQFDITRDDLDAFELRAMGPGILGTYEGWYCPDDHARLFIRIT
jgi:hypothetical protein